MIQAAPITARNSRSYFSDSARARENADEMGVSAFASRSRAARVVVNAQTRRRLVQRGVGRKSQAHTMQSAADKKNPASQQQARGPRPARYPTAPRRLHAVVDAVLRVFPNAFEVEERAS
jgi:hypothetical protein